jgi:hypothetical protein
VRALCQRLAALFGLSLIPACSAALPAPPPSRALCYAAADQRAQARVDAECAIGDAGVPFSECPARDEILASLKADQEGCP